MEQCGLDQELYHRWHPRMLWYGQSASGARDERKRCHSLDSRTPVRAVLKYFTTLYSTPTIGSELCELAWGQIYQGTTVHLRSKSYNHYDLDDE